jgi:hypothetical protein
MITSNAYNYYIFDIYSFLALFFETDVSKKKFQYTSVCRKKNSIRIIDRKDDHLKFYIIFTYTIKHNLCYSNKNN